MKTWPGLKKTQFLRAICEDGHEEKYWTGVFDAVAGELIDTWDYQWNYACWSQSGLSILPAVNLVSNIGFGKEATHTSIDSPLANLPVYELSEIIHPEFVVRNHEADSYTFDHIFGGKSLKEAEDWKRSFRRYMTGFNQRFRKILCEFKVQ
jgi:hypothetical protein